MFVYVIVSSVTARLNNESIDYIFLITGAADTTPILYEGTVDRRVFVDEFEPGVGLRIERDDRHDREPFQQPASPDNRQEDNRHEPKSSGSSLLCWQSEAHAAKESAQAPDLQSFEEGSRSIGLQTIESTDN